MSIYSIFVRDIIRIFVIAIFLFSSKTLAEDKLEELNWNLPLELNDNNSQIKFEVDSTWHMVHGKTSGIRGSAWLRDESDPSSVNVLLEIPVSNFNTDNSRRDKKLLNIMTQEKYPNVIFKASHLKQGCKPDKIIEKKECQDILSSELQIRDTKIALDVPISISSLENGYLVSGSLPIKWADYGVKDPSLFLIASVEPIVTIKFRISLIKKI